MKYFKEEKKKLIARAFEDFKKLRKSNNVLKFSYDDFIDFINIGDYGLIAYKFFADEYELENKSGKLSVSVYEFLIAKTRKNEKTADVKKIGKKLFEIMG